MMIEPSATVDPGVVDIVVVGGGPAGVAAAVSAAEAGASVVLVDENPALGGQIWRQGPGNTSGNPRSADGGTAPAAARPWLRKLHEFGVRRLRPAMLVDIETAPGACPSGRFSLLLDTPDGAVRMAASELVLATGAVERFLPFPGWTLPGVLGAGGLQAMIKGGLDIAGLRVVVAGSGPLLLAVAALARRRGAKVVALAEQAPFSAVRSFALTLGRHPKKIPQGLALGLRLGFGRSFGRLGVPISYGTWVMRAEARADGQDRADGALGRVIVGGDTAIRAHECDLLACAFGLEPYLGIAHYMGCSLGAGTLMRPRTPGGLGTPSFSAAGGRRVLVDPLQQTSVPGVWAAGEITGVGGVDLALIEGQIAGFAAAGAVRPARRLLQRRHHERRFAQALEQAFRLRDELRDLVKDDTLVCRCEDVSWGRIQRHLGVGSELSAVRSPAAAYGPDLRSLKLETRCGMGPCQGRVCGASLDFLLSESWPPGSLPRLHDNARPPFCPVTLETLMRREPRVGAGRG